MFLFITSRKSVPYQCRCSLASLNVQDSSTCLYMACHNGHLEVVKYLCNLGGDELLGLTQKVSLIQSILESHIMQWMWSMGWVIRGLRHKSIRLHHHRWFSRLEMQGYWSSRVWGCNTGMCVWAEWGIMSLYCQPSWAPGGGQVLVWEQRREVADADGGCECGYRMHVCVSTKSMCVSRWKIMTMVMQKRQICICHEWSSYECFLPSQWRVHVTVVCVRWHAWCHTQEGESCLYMACQNGHFELVKYLYERGGEKLLMLTLKVRLHKCM